MGILTFVKKIIKIPTSRQKQLSKLAETNDLLLFYSLKLKDQMCDVQSKSPDIRHSEIPVGCPTLPPPLGLTLIGALLTLQLYDF